MDPSHLPSLIPVFGPTLLAGLLAGIMALRCRSAWKACFTGFLGTIILAMALATAADRLSFWSQGWAPVPVTWRSHLVSSIVLGLPLGLVCAAWVGGPAPPTLNH